MIISKTLFAALVLFSPLLWVVNCDAESLPLRKIAKGALSGIAEARQEVIKDQAAWERWWTKHAVKGNSLETIPTIDFSKEMVIAVTMGRRNTGGHSIEITTAETAGQQLKISVRRTSPPPGAMVMQALTAPFHFVSVPKSDLPPEFVEVKPPAKMP